MPHVNTVMHRVVRCHASAILAVLAGVVALFPTFAMATTTNFGSYVYPMALQVSTVSGKAYVAVQQVSSDPDGGPNGPDRLVSVDGTTGASTSIVMPWPGVGPSLELDDVHGRAYVISGNRDMAIVDVASSSIATLCAAGLYDRNAVVDCASERLYAISGDRLLALDGKTGAQLGTLDLGGSGWGNLVMSKSTGKLYATNSYRGWLAEVDPVDSTVSTLAVGDRPVRVVLNETANKAYVLRRGADLDFYFGEANGAVSVVDLESRNVTSFGVDGVPYGVAVNNLLNKAYVVVVSRSYSEESGEAISAALSLVAFDGSTDASTTIPLGPSGPSDWCAPPVVNEISGKVYVARESGGSGALLTYDATKNTVATRSGLPCPRFFAINPVIDKGYICSSAGLTTFPLSQGLERETATVYLKRTTTLKYWGGSGTIRWRSSNTGVATVSSTGVVTGLRTGTAYISATRNGIKSVCKVTVKKAPFKLSLSRSVSSGRGYINVTAKTYSGRYLKYRNVNFYRNGAYIGTAKTNAYGKAKLRVSKNRTDATYKVRVSGDSLHNTTYASKVLVFVIKVFDSTGTDILQESLTLGSGSYKVYLYGDGDLWGAIVTSHGSDVSFSGTDGASGSFTVNSSSSVAVSALSWEDGGTIQVVIYKYL